MDREEADKLARKHARTFELMTLLLQDIPLHHQLSIFEVKVGELCALSSDPYEAIKSSLERIEEDFHAFKTALDKEGYAPDADL